MKILFLQTSPSQLDNPFYSALSKKIGKENISVYLWNSYGLERKKIDPELGLIPQFPKFTEDIITWVDKTKFGTYKLFYRILQDKYDYILLQDQTWKEKLILLFLLRISGKKVGMRTDKNLFSATARSGLVKAIESFIVTKLFNFLAPVSQLTSEYFNVKDTNKVCEFPYCTNEEKFAPAKSVINSARDQLRSNLSIASDAVVYLAIVKFNDRENPHLVIDAFIELSKRIESIHLILVGDGPLRQAIDDKVSKSGAKNISLVGYVNYVGLENYFFAADVFMHLPKVGPWEVSVPDALVAGLKVLASDVVGSAHVCMVNEAQKYIISTDNLSLVVDKLEQLKYVSNDLFESSKNIVNERFTVGAVSDRWSNWLMTLN